MFIENNTNVTPELSEVTEAFKTLQSSLKKGRNWMVAREVALGYIFKNRFSDCLIWGMLKEQGLNPRGEDLYTALFTAISEYMSKGGASHRANACRWLDQQRANRENKDNKFLHPKKLTQHIVDFGGMYKMAQAYKDINTPPPEPEPDTDQLASDNQPEDGDTGGSNNDGSNGKAKTERAKRINFNRLITWEGFRTQYKLPEITEGSDVREEHAPVVLLGKISKNGTVTILDPIDDAYGLDVEAIVKHQYPLRVIPINDKAA